MNPAHQPQHVLANPPAIDETPVTKPTTQQQDTSIHSDRIPRRSVLGTTVAGTIVVAAGAGVAACSTNPTSPPGGRTAASSGSSVLGTTSDVPVAGGKIFPSQQVVVTQPVAGTFKGFSSTCTHQGCQVSQITAGLIECPCHGSKFSATDGSVQTGPAPKPLPPANITVNGNQIILNG